MAGELRTQTTQDASDPAMDAGFRTIEHTAEIGIAAWGPTPGRAFAEAARGMYGVLLGRDPFALKRQPRRKPVPVEVEGAEWSDLLVNWLVELLVMAEVDGFVPSDIAVETCAPPRCVARLQGSKLNMSREARGVGIKAITYHGLRIDVTDARTEVQVIFDI